MENFTSGEKAAASRGNDVITREQLAAMYIFAKEMVNRNEDTRGRGDNALTRNAIKMNANTTMDDFRKLPSTRLADVLDLKPRTVSRTISKFKMIFNGNRQGTASESISPKYLKSFDEFSSMQIAEVLTMANEAINIQAESVREEEEAKNKKVKKENKGEILNMIKAQISTSFTDFKKKFEPAKAANMVISFLVNKYNVEAKVIKEIATKVYKLDPVSAKYFVK